MDIADKALGAYRRVFGGHLQEWCIAIFVGLAWSALCLFSWLCHSADEQRNVQRSAAIAARSRIEQDGLYRRWTAGHGGIYVRANETPSPNADQGHVKERDIATDGGAKLTLIDPAYMTRQVHELGGESNGVFGEIVGVRPRSKQTAPDDFGKQALEAFRQGRHEFTRVVEVHGEPHLRLMKPFICETQCLQCHADQGFRVGEVQGGLGSAVPLSPYQAIADERLDSLFQIHFSVWLCGMGVISYVSVRARTYRKIRRQGLRTQQQLVEAGEELNRFFECCPDMICIVGLDGVFHRINPIWEHVLGYSNCELVGKRFIDFVHPDDIGRTNDVFDTQLAGESVNQFENRYLCKDGTYRWLEWRADAPHGDRVYAAARDVTERRESEEKLHTLLVNHEAAVRGGNVGLWHWNLETNDVWFSPEWKAQIGYEDHEIDNRFEEWERRVHPDDLPRVLRKVEQFIRNGEHYCVEFRFAHRRGGYRWICAESSNVLNSEGKVVRACGSQIDITDRKQAEENQRRAQAVVEKILESVPVGIAIVDKNKKIRRVNQTAADMLRCEQSSLIGKPCYNTLCRLDQHACPIHDLGQPIPSSEHELIVGESVLPVLKSVTPIEFDNEELLLHTFVDLRERKQVELARREAEKTTAATNAKMEFFRNMSHEIRTPLTAIIGYTELMIDECARNATADKLVSYLQTVDENSKHLLTLINDILDLSKIDAEKMSVESVKCQPAGIVAEVASLMGERARAKGLRFETTCETAIPTRITSDPTKIRQVLINLVGNAIKFTEVGHVRLAARLNESATDMATLEFVVSDSGIGMTDAEVQQLFRPFSQVDSSLTRRHGGTGLGLTISKRIAELLGGDIDVESSLGKGSAFRFTLNPGPIKGVPRTTSFTYSARGGTGKNVTPIKQPQLAGKILLVEDGPDNQRLIGFILRKAGAEVSLACNGVEAIERCLVAADRESRDGSGEPGLARAYDVILMDMQMPVMDGYTATRVLRERGYAGPILALTAHAMDGERDKCLAAGCDGYLTKPIQRDQFFAELTKWMPSDPAARGSKVDFVGSS
jgi:PAS domain S-box-containing protein